MVNIRILPKDTLATILIKTCWRTGGHWKTDCLNHAKQGRLCKPGATSCSMEGMCSLTDGVQVSVLLQFQYDSQPKP